MREDPDTVAAYETLCDERGKRAIIDYTPSEGECVKDEEGDRLRDKAAKASVSVSVRSVGAAAWVGEYQDRDRVDRGPGRAF